MLICHRTRERFAGPCIVKVGLSDKFITTAHCATLSARVDAPVGGEGAHHVTPEAKGARRTAHFCEVRPQDLRGLRKEWARISYNQPSAREFVTDPRPPACMQAMEDSGQQGRSAGQQGKSAAFACPAHCDGLLTQDFIRVDSPRRALVDTSDGTASSVRLNRQHTIGSRRGM